MSPIRREATYYDSGQLKSEVVHFDDGRSSITRRWHENGALKSEAPFMDSQYHGVVRQWNASQRLLGESILENGTGIFRTWHDNGVMTSEAALRGGVPHGRMRIWDEVGEFTGDAFFINGRQVSRRKYDLSCDRDDSLPKYHPEDTASVDENAEATVPPSDLEVDYSSRCDAIEWLHGSSGQCVRTIGELPSVEDSISWVNEFIEGGANRVFVIYVQTDDDGGQNTGHLLIELPSEPRDRKRALEFCNEQNRLTGHRSVKDVGQQFVHVILD